MAGYRPRSFCVCLWTEAESSAINSQKRTRPISNHLDRKLLSFRNNFCRGTRQVVPNGQDSSILPARVARQSQRAIWVILPAHGNSHIIIIINTNVLSQFVVLVLFYVLMKITIGNRIRAKLRIKECYMKILSILHQPLGKCNRRVHA